MAGQRAGRRVLGPDRIHLDRFGITDAVAAQRVADDVVVEHGFDGNAGLLQVFGVNVRADEALLFSSPRDEHQRRIELDATLRKRPRQLHRQHGAAAVIVGAVGFDVGIESRTGLSIAARGRGAGR
jgi:hypothetical protein